MGFKYTDRVYRDVVGTSATEQLVLLALAHAANDKTGECFPSLETLAKRTHLNRSSVRRSLDALKEKELLKWISGGRRKNGRVLSNLYKLNLPRKTNKREEDVVFGSWDDVENTNDRGSLCTPYQAHSEPTHGLTVSPLPGAECTPIINTSSIDHPEEYNQTHEASDTTPGRFELGVARRNGTLDDVLAKMDAAANFTRRREKLGPVQMAMDAACTNKVDDRKTFSLVMMHKNPQDCVDAIFRFESERNAGEMSQIKNLPALLTKRLKELRDVD